MGRATDVNPSNNGDLRHYRKPQPEASPAGQGEPTGSSEPTDPSERRMTGRLAAAIFWGERGLGVWVLLVAMVTASMGVFLLGGGALGGLAAQLLGYRQPADAPPIIVGLAMGGLTGVWVGSWVGVRLTGAGGRRRLIAAGTGATLGLLVAVVLAWLRSRLAPDGLAPILVILAAIVAPGLGAVLGDGLQARLKGPGNRSGS
jgi:hypothetical protein